MNFAGMDAGQFAALGQQVEVLERLIQILANISDPKKLEANALMCKRAQEEALAEMARVAEAQRALDSRENALNTRERELAARDLEGRELRLNQREAAISEREQKWAAVTAQVRGVAA